MCQGVLDYLYFPPSTNNILIISLAPTPPAINITKLWT